jgi:hypothetical protein
MAAMLLLVAWQLLPGARATAQAVPAGSGDTNPEDQPLPGQDLGSSLTLNQGVNAIGAENESFERYGLGLAASGGEVTNFLGSQTNKQNAAFIQFNASGGLKLQSSRTRYYALYQPQYYIYPQYTNVNNFSQSFFQSVDHSFSNHTVMSWGTTAARYLSLSEFLPQNLGIGGIGVIVPTPGQELLDNSFELTNAATNLSLRHLMSAKMTFTATVTGAYFMEVPTFVVGEEVVFPAQRFLTLGADVRLEYQWRPRDAVGVAATPIYVDGLKGEGHQSAETVQGTYQRQLTSTLSASVGAGPLFIQSSSSGFGSVHDNSYALTASISRQLRQSQFSAAYSRALLVNLLEPAAVTNTFSGSAYLPEGNHWIFSGAASYTHNAASSLYGAGHVYGGSAQASYQLTTQMQLFARYSLISQTYTFGTPQQSNGFTRNQFGGGIRFNLGNAITHGGLQ